MIAFIIMVLSKIMNLWSSFGIKNVAFDVFRPKLVGNRDIACLRCKCRGKTFDVSEVCIKYNKVPSTADLVGLWPVSDEVSPLSSVLEQS